MFKTSCVRILDTKCDRLCRCTVLSLLIQIESEHSNLFSKSNQSLHCSFLFQLSFPNQVLLTTLLQLLYSKVSTAIRCCFTVRVWGFKKFPKTVMLPLSAASFTPIPYSLLVSKHTSIKRISLHFTLEKTSPLLSHAKYIKSLQVIFFQIPCKYFS